MVMVMAEMPAIHITVTATAVAVDVGRQGAPADVVERRPRHLPRHGRASGPDGSPCPGSRTPVGPRRRGTTASCWRCWGKARRAPSPLTRNERGERYFLDSWTGGPSTAGSGRGATACCPVTGTTWGWSSCWARRSFSSRWPVCSSARTTGSPACSASRTRCWTTTPPITPAASPLGSRGAEGCTTKRWASRSRPSCF